MRPARPSLSVLRKARTESTHAVAGAAQPASMDRRLQASSPSIMQHVLDILGLRKRSSRGDYFAGSFVERIKTEVAYREEHVPFTLL